MRRSVAAAALIAWCMPVAALAADGARATGRRASAPTDYRLHAPAPAAPRTAILDGAGARLRTGFGGSLIDLYPFRNSGFHVSAGGRLFGRAGRPRSGDPDFARLLTTPRAGGRGGRRPSPAALVGIGRTVGQRLALGLDGGAALGRLYNGPNRLGRFQPGRSGGGEGRLNEIARVTMLYRF